MYLFSNVLGVFVFDNGFKVVDEMLFKDILGHKNKEEFIEKLRDKYGISEEPDENSVKKMLLHFKSPEYFNGLYTKNLEITKLDVKNSVNEDIFIIQSVKSIGELDKAINLLIKRLREWYDIYNPEFSRATEDHEKFVGEMLNSEKGELLKKINAPIAGSMGADLSPENLEPIKSLAHQIYSLYQLRKSQLDYISALMDGYCPNLKAVCDALVAAKLVEHAGSLKRLSSLPASTVQVLGAEKALFRHMKTGARPPRHGVIVSHDLIAKASDKMHGKIARSLADKISIAAKVDYFRGQFIGDKLRKALEEKFK